MKLTPELIGRVILVKITVKEGDDEGIGIAVGKLLQFRMMDTDVMLVFEGSNAPVEYDTKDVHVTYTITD